MTEQDTSAADLFRNADVRGKPDRDVVQQERLPRLDINDDLRKLILPYCRLKLGEIWDDPISGHRVGVLDAKDANEVARIFGEQRADLALNDPPYNIRVGNKTSDALFSLSETQYDDFTKKWVRNCISHLKPDASFYCWLGADYKRGFYPMPEFISLMRSHKDLIARNWITVRNQRGFGTQRNWMWVRQELLYYVKGMPFFDVQAEYTEIPKVLKGYYKAVNGKFTENLERSKSNNIRAGNVWLDIQQVFYRMEENVPGCYAQKPLKSIERIVTASCPRGGVIVDLFAHSGTTLLAGERLGRKVITVDIDPIYAELTIRRLERFRRTNKLGWQWANPFSEIDGLTYTNQGNLDSL